MDAQARDGNERSQPVGQASTSQNCHAAPGPGAQDTATPTRVHTASVDHLKQGSRVVTSLCGNHTTDNRDDDRALQGQLAFPSDPRSAGEGELGMVAELGSRLRDLIDGAGDGSKDGNGGGREGNQKYEAR